MQRVHVWRSAQIDNMSYGRRDIYLSHIRKKQ